KAKIRLSAFEIELVTNTEWIFAKQLIIEKVYHLFGRLNEDFKKIIGEEKIFFIPELQKKNGKISKGENYKGLPYIILDYPALFSKENIFAVRTLFWWGNYFSISLHLSGKYLQHLRQSQSVFSFLQDNDFSVCINENEWQHDFEESNYVNISKLNLEEINKIFEKPFFKIAQKIDLQEWDKAEIFLTGIFKKLIDFIAISFPACEKAL
ncbi:MAG: hypothetical protein ABI359_02530, partial [Ginsengibacter sp.]